MPGVLAIIERGQRGAAETQFADVLYLVRELNRQLGRVDLALRGEAVACALAGDGAPAIVVGGRALEDPPDPRRSVRALLDDGAAVLVDIEDLAALGLGVSRLLARTEPVDPQALVRRWSDYDGVWFL